MRLWDVASGKLLRALEGHDGPVLGVAFSPDGLTLASGSADSSVRLWDIASGTLLRTLTGHKGWIRSVAFSPDGRALASGSNDRSVRLWDVASGTFLCALDRHDGPVWSVAFSPDSLSLASASNDGTIRLWHVPSGACLAVFLPRPEGWAAYDPDGRFKLDGDIKGAFWHVIALCRFEPGELDPYLPQPLRVPDHEPLIQLPRSSCAAIA